MYCAALMPQPAIPAVASSMWPPATQATTRQVALWRLRVSCMQHRKALTTRSETKNQNASFDASRLNTTSSLQTSNNCVLCGLSQNGVRLNAHHFWSSEDWVYHSQETWRTVRSEVKAEPKFDQRWTQNLVDGPINELTATLSIFYPSSQGFDRKVSEFQSTSYPQKSWRIDHGWSDMPLSHPNPSTSSWTSQGQAHDTSSRRTHPTSGDPCCLRWYHWGICSFSHGANRLILCCLR